MKNNIKNAAESIIKMYKELNDPNDHWKNVDKKQALRDSLEALKRNGCIKNYNLNDYTIEEMK